MLVTKKCLAIIVQQTIIRMRHTSQLQPSAALLQLQLDWMLLQESTPTTHSVTVAMSGEQNSSAARVSCISRSSHALHLDDIQASSPNRHDQCIAAVVNLKAFIC